MFEFYKRWFHYYKDSAYAPPKTDPALSQRLGENLLDNMVTIRQLYANSEDLVTRGVQVSGLSAQLLFCEGMVDNQAFAELVAEPLTSLELPDATPASLQKWLREESILAIDQKEFYTFGELFTFLMSGFVVLLLDGVATGTALGIQGFNFRGVSEPTTEINVRGSKESFVEPVRINLTLIRRRIKSPTMKFESLTVGSKSNTSVYLVYLTDCVSQDLLQEVKNRLAKVKMDVILSSGYLQPYLDEKTRSIFSGVGITERPDTLCAKIREGRIAILVDGTPFALIVPYLFHEHFQSLDDYAQRPYYATFIRWLKYLSFFVSMLLPGLYVAMVSFHPELFPHALLLNVAASETITPFPIMLEALLIHVIYEIMREAGLRLPRPIGHAVGIVGALVIGDAAVTAGLIGAPMVMVVALTAISSFVVPSLYEPVTVLRLAFILVGGMLGLYGITLLLLVVGLNLCAVNPFGIPATSPETPFSLYAMRDVLVRAGWKHLGGENLRVQDLPGSEVPEKRGGAQ